MNLGSYPSLLETVDCNLCGSQAYEIIYPARYGAAPDSPARNLRASGDEILVDQLVRCTHCGLYYVNPRPQADLILQGYRTGQDEVFVSQAAAREKTFVKGLEWIERYAPQRGRILDVGTAGGSFLGVAKERGWEVAGCEVNPWLAEWGNRRYGLKIQPATIEEMDLEPSSLDVVSLWDVLEHLTDPFRTLRECRRVLRGDGILVINFPDIRSGIARLMGEKWVFLLSVHLYYFTVLTLKKLLERAGFSLVEHRRHWQSLDLGYICERMTPYLAAARWGRKTAERIGIERIHLPYWMGQTLAMARCGRNP